MGRGHTAAAPHASSEDAEQERLLEGPDGVEMQQVPGLQDEACPAGPAPLAQRGVASLPDTSSGDGGDSGPAPPSPSQQPAALPSAAAAPSSCSADHSAVPADGGASCTKGEPSLCRICFEEDTAQNLCTPCGCTGTQRFAHHACIQRWVEEKGHLRCEVCAQLYRGAFEVPPPPPAPLAVAGETVMHPLFGPMFIRMDEEGGVVRPSALELYEEQEQYQQRHSGTSWCFTFIIFVMFLVVLHHTMIVADGVDGTPGADAGGVPGPGDVPAAASSGEEDDPYATSLTFFLFWVGSKALLIGIPLYTVMKIAARQAQREQYESMYGAGGHMGGTEAGSRMMQRVRATMAAAARRQEAAVGPNAV